MHTKRKSKSKAILERLIFQVFSKRFYEDSHAYKKLMLRREYYFGRFHQYVIAILFLRFRETLISIGVSKASGIIISD